MTLRTTRRSLLLASLPPSLEPFSLLQVARDCVTASQGDQRRADALPATVDGGNIHSVSGERPISVACESNDCESAVFAMPAPFINCRDR